MGCQLLGLSELVITSISNEDFNRDHGYTIYYNMLMELASSRDVLAISSHFAFVLSYLLGVSRPDKFIVRFSHAPSLLNPFLPLALSMLVILGGALLVMVREF